MLPGTFDPLTVAHLALADAAREVAGLAALDLSVSRTALGKEHLDPARLEVRLGTLRRTAAPHGLGVVVTAAQLLVDVAEGYDVVVVGADKLAQVLDPAWYGGDAGRRDEALERLPTVAVARRAGHDLALLRAASNLVDLVVVDLPEWMGEVSSTAVRAGRAEWAAEEPGAGPGAGGDAGGDPAGR